jgi:hypothetical protein
MAWARSPKSGSSERPPTRLLKATQQLQGCIASHGRLKNCGCLQRFRPGNHQSWPMPAVSTTAAIPAGGLFAESVTRWHLQLLLNVMRLRLKLPTTTQPMQLTHGLQSQLTHGLQGQRQQCKWPGANNSARASWAASRMSCMA